MKYMKMAVEKAKAMFKKMAELVKAHPKSSLVVAAIMVLIYLNH